VTKILSGYESIELMVPPEAGEKLSISKDLAVFCGVLAVLVIGLSIAAHVTEPVKPTRTFKLR
jgi:hypothetical protein